MSIPSANIPKPNRETIVNASPSSPVEIKTSINPIRETRKPLKKVLVVLGVTGLEVETVMITGVLLVEELDNCPSLPLTCKMYVPFPLVE